MLYQGRFDKNKPTYEAAWKAWNLAFNAAPKKNVNMSHSWTKEQEWKDEKTAEKVKTATKLGMKHCDTKLDFAFANDKWSVRAGHPVLTDDWNVHADAFVEHKPAANEWKVESNAKVASPNMSGSKIFANFGAEYN